MSELQCIQIRLPNGINCYISYYRGSGEVGRVQVTVTLVSQWIKMGEVE